MGDSEDEFRAASGGRLKAGGPRGGRRLRLRLRPPPPASAPTEKPGQAAEGGDATAEEGLRGRCQRAQAEDRAQGSAPQGTQEPSGTSASNEEEEKDHRAGGLPTCKEEEELALQGDPSWGFRGALPQELLQPRSQEEEGGWVFCQICQKDLSAMNSVRREQHVNRCLDDLEGPLLAPPERGPLVPECPICGKGFSSLRSRRGHLKRCAATMEVPPPLLLQAVRQQQQQQEALGIGLPAAQSRSKRKGTSSRQRLLKKRRAAAEVDGLTEDLLVAMAMSRSLVEEEGKAKQLAGSRQGGALQSRRPRKAEQRRIGAKVGRPLPLLLGQDHQEAHRRIEARVAQLLSEAEEAFPSTPLLPPSRLLAAELPQQAGGPGCSLWEASSLAGPLGSFQATDFARSASLQMPEEGAGQNVAVPSSGPTRPAEREQGAASGGLLQGGPSGDSRERLPCQVGEAEALQDLVELAGEGLTLTQCQEGPGQGWLPGDVVQSGFLQPLEKRQPQRSSPPMLPLGSLAEAFRGMVNNPHLSDIQFQVDTGELLYGHLFVLYARCPQLMEMVGCEGFLVAEEGGPGTRRLLLGDVSKEALGAFLSYLYTADVSVPPHVQSEVAALATRFGAMELAGVCGGCQSAWGAPGAGEEAGEKRAETFEELLRSMWLEEEEEALLAAGQPEEADSEEVGEQELEQIYEFAATQRRAAHGGPKLGQGAPSPRKGPWESAVDRAAGTELAGSLCTEQAHLPAAPAAASARGTWHRVTAGRVSQAEEEENWAQHEHSAVLFPALQGDCSGRSQQRHGAREQGGSAASQGPASPGFPSLLPLGSSSPKQGPPSPGSPLALPSPAPPQLSTRGQLSSPPSDEAEQPGRKKSSPGPHCSPGGRGTLEGSLIVLLDSEDEAEPAEAVFSLAGVALSETPCAGSWQCQLSQGGAGVPSGRRLSLPHSCGVGPGALRSAGGGSPLASTGEDSWAEASSWRVPDTPRLGRGSSKCPELTQLPLVPGTEGAKGAGESPPTHNSTTGQPLLGPPSSWKKPASSPVVVVGDSEEELESAAPWPRSSPLVPGEASWCPSEEEEEGDSLLCLTADVPTPLGTPTAASGERSPPTRSPMDGGTAAPHLGERGAAAGEDSDSSEVLPLTQRMPDHALEAGSQTPRAAPPTPMPSYSIMETPKLKKELRRFGVRALPKRKMILKLKEIFQYTHQGARGNSQEKAVGPSQLTSPNSPVQPLPRKPRLAVASSPIAKQLAGSAEPPQGPRGSFRVDSGRGCEGLGQASEPHGSGRLPGTASLPGGFPPGGSPKDSAPMASQESMASSGTGSDGSAASQSSSSMEFSSLVEEEEEEHVPPSQAAAREAHKLAALRHHLGSKPALCRQILLYQPIELAGLQAELKQSGIRIAMGKLMDFLDAHCITFTTAEARREKQRHSKKRRRRF